MLELFAGTLSEVSKEGEAGECASFYAEGVFERRSEEGLVMIDKCLRFMGGYVVLGRIIDRWF